MLCDRCLTITDNTYLCNNQHTFCQDCMLVLVNRQCPKCINKEVMDFPTGTIPKATSKLTPNKTRHSTNEISFDAKCIDLNDPNRMNTIDSLRQELAKKYCLEPLKIGEHKYVQDYAENQRQTQWDIQENYRLSKARRNDAIRRTEQQIKEQILTQVYTNLNTNSNIYENVDACKAAMTFQHSAKLQSKSHPNPNPIHSKPGPINCSKSTRDLDQKGQSPRAIFTPSTIVPDKDRSYKIALGQGDENVKTNDDPNNTDIETEEDIPIDNFVEFIHDKFRNMKLSSVKQFLSAMSIDKKALESSSDWCVRGAESQMNCVFPEDPLALEDLYRPLTAFRAMVRNEINNSGEPVMQSSSIDAFDGCELSNEPVGMLLSSFDFRMPRNPVACPISTCNNTLVFVSDFTRHIKMNHVRVPVEELRPQVGINFFVDPNLDDVGSNRCRMLFLVTGKIKDLGRTDYKNYLPIMVMTTRLRLSDIFPSKHIRGAKVSPQFVFMIWLTGLCPNPNSTHVTLIVWARRHKNQPELHRVLSGQLYCIREPQTGSAVFRNGHALILTTEQCDAITSDGKTLLKIQVIVH